jgi:hypothetical protein
MAKTGSTSIGLAPHPGYEIFNESQAEKAGQVHASGAVAQLGADGFMIASATGTLSTGYGISMEAGQDLATDGAAKMSLHRFEQGKKYIGTLNGVFAQTDIGSEATIAQASGGIPTFTKTGGTGTWRIVELIPGWEIGDTNVRIGAIPKDSFIEQGGGNE